MISQGGQGKRTEGRDEDWEQWRARRKAESVLRLLRDEDLGEVRREINVPPPTLEKWTRMVLERGQQVLKARSRDPA